MMYGLNTHTIGFPPTNRTAVVQDQLSVPKAGFFNRPRIDRRDFQPPIEHIAKIGELVPWYMKNRDADSVTVLDHIDVQPHQDMQPTPADARFRFFVEDGNVYAQVLEGRNQERVSVVAWVRHQDGALTAHTMNIEIRTQLEYRT